MRDYLDNVRHHFSGTATRAAISTLGSIGNPLTVAAAKMASRERYNFWLYYSWLCLVPETLSLAIRCNLRRDGSFGTPLQGGAPVLATVILQSRDIHRVLV